MNEPVGSTPCMFGLQKYEAVLRRFDLRIQVFASEEVDADGSSPAKTNFDCSTQERSVRDRAREAAVECPAGLTFSELTHALVVYIGCRPV
jgi:hypothetical protein